MTVRTPAPTHIELTVTSITSPIYKQPSHRFSYTAFHTKKKMAVNICLVSAFRSLPCKSILMLTTPNCLQTWLCSSCCHNCLIFFSSRAINIHPSTPVLIFLLSPFTLFSETRVLKEGGFGLYLRMGFSLRNFDKTASVALSAHSCASRV